MDDVKNRRAVTCAGGVQDKMVISNIMQRFRPIAPKPATAGGSFKALDDTKSFTGRSIRRSKRKYVRVRKNHNNSNNNNNNNDNGYKGKTKVSRTDLEKAVKGDNDDNTSLRKNIVTLQLLPEKDDSLGAGETEFGFTDSDSKNNSTGDCTDHRGDNNYQYPLAGLITSLSGDDDRMMILGLTSSDRTVVESWVTVERVTGTYTDQLGCTDEERVRRLEVDKCPGFVSDWSKRVGWVNGAYRRMVGLSAGNNYPAAVMVCLVVDEDNGEEMVCMGELYGAVTCRVRIQYDSATCQKEKNRPATVKMTVPCDVWRMDFGGFAWRLDVEAALSLGR